MGLLGTTPALERKKYVNQGPATRTVDELVIVTAAKESGAAGYAALNQNDVNAGVSFGLIQFNQKHGGLGELFRRMYEADPDTFVALTYGDTKANKDPQALAEQLIEELNDKKRALAGPLARRLAQPNWSRRFRALGGVEAFQQLQNQLACEHYVVPAKALATQYDLRSERAHALLIDLCVQHGPEGAERIVSRAIARNPRDTQELRDATEETRAAEEHDMLVHIGEASAQLVKSSPNLPSSVLDVVVRRRKELLRDPTLSDKEPPLEASVRVQDSPPQNTGHALSLPRGRTGFCLRQDI